MCLCVCVCVLGRGGISALTLGILAQLAQMLLESEWLIASLDGGGGGKEEENELHRCGTGSGQSE